MSYNQDPDDVDARLISASEIWSFPLTEFSFNELAHYVNTGAVFVELEFGRYSDTLLRLAQLTQAIKHRVPRLSHPLLVVIPPNFTPPCEVRDAIVRAGGLPFFAPKTYAIASDRTARLCSLYSHLQQLRAAVICNTTCELLSEISEERDLLARVNSEDE